MLCQCPDACSVESVFRKTVITLFHQSFFFRVPLFLRIVRQFTAPFLSFDINKVYHIPHGISICLSFLNFSIIFKKTGKSKRGPLTFTVVPGPNHAPLQKAILASCRCCKKIKEATIFTTSHLFQSLRSPFHECHVVKILKVELFLQRDLILCCKNSEKS